MARIPTQLQLDTLDFLHEYIEREGMPPTVREIGAHFGITSTNAVTDRLRALERKGLVRHLPRSPRSWRPV